MLLVLVGFYFVLFCFLVEGVKILALMKSVKENY